jgi:hypothetical protein
VLFPLPEEVVFPFVLVLEVVFGVEGDGGTTE